MRPCRVRGCGGKHYAMGHCKRHYAQVQRNGRVTIKGERRPRGPCAARGCDRKDVHRVGDRALCPKHRRQVRVYGRLTPERERGRAGR